MLLALLVSALNCTAMRDLARPSLCIWAGVEAGCSTDGSVHAQRALMGMSWMPVRETSSRSLQWTLRTWMQLGTMSTSHTWLEHPQIAERGLRVAQSTFQPRQASYPTRSPSDVRLYPSVVILCALTLQVAAIAGGAQTIRHNLQVAPSAAQIIWLMVPAGSPAIISCVLSYK